MEDGEARRGDTRAISRRLVDLARRRDRAAHHSGRRTLDHQADEAFARLYDEEFRVVAHAALMIVGSPTVAQDLAQDAYAAAWARWRHVRDLDRPGAWVRRVAINLALKERRRSGRLRLDGGTPTTDELPRDREPAVEGTVLPDGLLDDTIARTVANLPTKQRLAVALRYVHDLPMSDVAESLGCSESTARVHLHRARRTLAEVLPPLLEGP